MCRADAPGAYTSRVGSGCRREGSACAKLLAHLTWDNPRHREVPRGWQGKAWAQTDGGGSQKQQPLW